MIITLVVLFERMSEEVSDRIELLMKFNYLNQYIHLLTTNPYFVIVILAIE